MQCPIPISTYPTVTMAHGGGGRLMQQLIDKMIVGAFADLGLQARDDAAVVDFGSSRLAFTTDSFVVNPIEFPGGDIGKLAVYGTVNDLATTGATPRALSLGLIIEEGLPMETLWRITCSIADACRESGVQLLTGDTKVVDRGTGDGLYINTSGIGVLDGSVRWSPAEVRPGDVVLLSGDVGRHGMAVMAVRDGLSFETDILSDCAPLNRLTAAMQEAGVNVRCARDLTRGGLASAANEIALTARVQINLDERRIAVQAPVRAACEVLGIDPLYVANEGRMLFIVEPGDADKAESILQSFAEDEGAGAVGLVATGPGRVALKSVIGVDRVLSLLSGEQLPRIC